MKHILFSLLFLPLGLAAQHLPLDTTTNRITFAEKSAKPGSRAVLYSKAKEWLILNSPNNTPAIVLDDKDTGKIIAKMGEGFTVVNNKGIPQKVQLNYLLNFTVIDNQVSYQLTNLEFQNGALKTNAENFITDEALAKRADRQEYFEAHKAEALKIIERVTKSLKGI